LRSSIPCCTSSAQRTASTGLAFSQEAVAGGLHDPAAMVRDPGLDQLPQMAFQALDGIFLIRAHQARIFRDIRHHYCRNATLDAFFCHGCADL
jgi:hypothetical protein